MRIGMLREKIEIWDTKKTINEYGIEVDNKDLFLACHSAVKHINNAVVGDTTQSFNITVEFTIRFNRYYKNPNNSMFVIWDNQEWDIINNSNFYSLNKFITLTAVKRNK